MMWFRRIHGMRKRRYWYIPITWQGFVVYAIQYGFLITILLFYKGLLALIIAVLLFVGAIGIKRAKSEPIGEQII